MSRRGPGSPAKMAVRIWALVLASPPWRVSMGARVRPTSSGVMVVRVTMPLWTSAKWLGPEMENSSNPAGGAVPLALVPVRRGRRRRGGC